MVPPWFGWPFFIFLLRQFFLTIPEELVDAAKIDGAGHARILLQIFIPLSQTGAGDPGDLRLHRQLE